MTKVRGRDVILYVEKESVFLVAACGISCSLEFEVEHIPIATVDSGTNQDYQAGMTGGSISLSALTSFDDGSYYNIDEFIDNRRTKQNVKIVFTDTAGNTLSYSMAVLIKTVRTSGSVEDFSSFDVEAAICGAYTKEKSVGGVVTSSMFDYSLDFNITG